MNRRTLRATLGAAFLVAIADHAATRTLAREPDRLTRAIESILKREVFRPAIVAIDIRDVDTGRVLFERNATTNVKPASTMKLFTTAAILDAEGPGGALAAHAGAVAGGLAGEGIEWRLHSTTIETAGRLDSFGRVLGDVYLVGRGDPNISDRIEWRGGKNPFDQMAAELKAAGITRFEGRLIGQDALFPDESIPDGWTADDLVWSYGAEVSALSAFDNSLRLRLDPGEKEGDAARLSQWPETAYMQIDARVKTSAIGSKQNLSLARALGSRRVTIEGSVPLGGTPWEGEIAAPEPALFATTLLAEALERHGISIRDTLSVSHGPLEKGLRPLASVRGPGIGEQIQIVNKESQNLHAETLLRRMGLAASGDASIDSSLRAREAFLRGRGVRIDDTAMLDGSGLSRADLVTVRAEVDLLVAMAKHPLYGTFRDSLPIAGKDGTLKRRMLGTKAEGRVFAKTGSLRHVNALAGYVDALSGRRLAFSIIVNHHTRPSKEATEAMDEICALLADLPAPRR